MTNIYEELIKLELSEHEIKKLYIHFTKNYNQIYEAELILSKYCKTDDDKYEYLESLLESSLLPDGPVVTNKLRIRDDFSEGLIYQKPKPLLSTIGINWEYQPDPSLHNILRKEIKDHYRYFTQEKFDKAYMPIYFFLSGAGTGKSRNATEFHNTVLKCLNNKEDDSKLKDMIQNALVFNVSFENGTSLKQVESDTYKAIGTRMLLQLLPDMNLDEIISTYEAPYPWEVLQLVAKNKKQDLKEIPVFLIIDALQHIIYDSRRDHLDPEYKFYRTISNIADLACQGAFLIPCCTATTTSPIHSVTKSLSNKCVYLPVPTLHSPTICKENSQESTEVFPKDLITKILVEDCGGHGRALETLQETLINHHDVSEDNINLLMNDLRNALTNRYIDVFSLSNAEIQTIAKAILLRQPLDFDKNIPGINKTPEQIVQHGLVQFEREGTIVNSKTGYLVAPYNWIWILAQQIGIDELLQKWQFDDYKEQKSLLSLESQSSRNFEQFIATIRCLKSRIIKEGELTKISEVHSGARLNGDIEFVNHHLKLRIPDFQEPTNSENSNVNILCGNEIINIRQGRYCIVNHASAQYGDSFISLDLEKNKEKVNERKKYFPLISNEVHQYKFWNDKEVNQKVYLNERNKVASTHDFLMLYTTKDCDKLELPENLGIVDKKNWNKYFGPFANRAFIFATPLDINTTNRKSLQQIRSIGIQNTEKILSKRPFINIENAIEKTGLSENVLEKFKFPFRRYHSLARVSHKICQNIFRYI
ncbi:unnamed protein product [Rhizophagus irregularis]|uniref:Uncharacterized protein n=1 Tax=Rhizophagus irregularis TaxID=588596 RepID=A0A2I1F6R3_9GLOM|nr:hypothetical protein RhiirB3_446960 [Rhizophagus irregularis]CAB5349616.1 unnamed protein product [Rhizophagus irregularis]